MNNSKTLLFASCDVEYYKKYAKSFVKSAAYNNHYVHVHIINPYVGMERIDHPLISYSFEENSPNTREYYASNRFFLAPEILMSNNDELKLLLLDIDTIIQKPIVLPDASVGFYLREPFQTNDWERRGTRLLAGVVMYDDTAWLFAKSVADKIKELPQYWFVDQVALAETMDDFSMAIKVHDFSKDENFMSWDLNNKEAAILTAKGSRKDTDQFKELIKYYENLEL